MDINTVFQVIIFLINDKSVHISTLLSNKGAESDDVIILILGGREVAVSVFLLIFLAEQIEASRTGKGGRVDCISIFVRSRGFSWD